MLRGQTDVALEWWNGDIAPRRLAEPEDIAGDEVALLSDAACRITSLCQ